MILAATGVQAQYVLGSFQGAGDPTDAGWLNPNDSDPITTDPNSSFVAAGVPGYPLSLQMNGTGGFGQPSLQLDFSAAEIAAFNANTYLTFTFSVPTGSSTGGYSQIYNIAFNAPTYGYNNFMSGGNAAATWGTYSQAEGSTGNNQNGEPNFYFYGGEPSLFSETVTVNYSSILSAIEAGGESYLQMTIQGNDGSGAPTIMDFNDFVLSTSPFGVDAVPEPTSMALLGLGGILGTFVIRGRKS